MTNKINPYINRSYKTLDTSPLYPSPLRIKLFKFLVNFYIIIISESFLHLPKIINEILEKKLFLTLCCAFYSLLNLSLPSLIFIHTHTLIHNTHIHTNTHKHSLVIFHSQIKSQSLNSSWFKGFYKTPKCMSQ